MGALGVLFASAASADAPPSQYGLFDMSNLVIADMKTGLTWQRYPSPTLFTFADAASTCAALSLDGPSLWRVPSYKELLTLVDEAPHPEYENLGVVWKAIDAHAFPGTAVDGVYWTSSPSAALAGSAFMVNFRTGEGAAYDAGFKVYVRCVHD